MSKQLLDNLNEIKNQKDTYLLPENIKKDVTVLGVTGTLETSTTSGGVKLFKTIEEMQADTTAKEGDLAVVYENGVQNVTADSKFQTATFPDTVVLDEAITSSVEVRYRAVDDSVMFDCMGSLSSSRFRMDCYTESGSIRIQYTSSDGITYTRTDTTGNPVDFGTEIYYEMPEMWNDAIGKFIQVGGSTFEGLYKYALNVPINSFKLREQRSANYNLTYTQSNPGLDKIYTGEEVFTGEDVGNKIREILKNEIRGVMFLSKDMSILYLVPTQFQNLYVYNNKLEPLVFNSADKAADIVYYKYTLSNMQHEEITMTKSELGIVDDGVVTNLPDDSYYVLGIVNSTGTYIRWTVSSVSYYQIYTVGTGTEIEYDDRYIIADTQLTATPEYVYGKEFYGQNGVETGIITQDISNSFADTNAEVYSKIQNQYENMEPRVLTDDDKTIDTNIYVIPVKTDGTVLLDTSNVTDMSSMFHICTNLTTIPLLNTSNATNMTVMFADCSSLTEVPLLDTSNVTNMNSMFANCSNLTEISLLNTSSVTDMGSMVSGCTSLTTIPQFDTSNVTNIGYMFSGCTSLTEIPLLDTSSVTNMNRTFYVCTNLSDESLNNILAMCVNATSYTGTKTLAYIGLTSEQANKCKTLSNYSAFTAAGWTTGY